MKPRLHHIINKCPSARSCWGWGLLVLLIWAAFPLGHLLALTNHGLYYPHGWQKPDMFGSKKNSDQMIDFDPAVENEETRREEFILANDGGRVLRLSHNGRVFCYIVDDDLYDPWLYQVVDYDGSGGFEMKEVPFTDFPLPRWTFINEPFRTTKTVDYTTRMPTREQLIRDLLGPTKKPWIPKYTPEQRAALAIARGGDMPPDECLPEEGEGDDPRVALKILFEFDKDVLTARAGQTLNILGQAMISPELSDAVFRIEGHTDAVGDFNYNMDLSRRRAQAVTRYLMENFNIASNRLIPVGMGETVPLANIDPEDGRNRRVEVVNITAGKTLTMPEADYKKLPPDPFLGR